MPRHRRGRRAGRARAWRASAPAPRPITWSTRCSSRTRRSRRTTTRSPSRTNDGRVVTGIKLRQTDTELVLRDAEDREVAIPLSADRRAEAGRLADARRPGRDADRERAARPGPVPLRARQDRPLRREQGAGHAALAGARDERRRPSRHCGGRAWTRRSSSRAWSGARPTARSRESCRSTRSRRRPASRTSSSTCRRWESPAARSTSRPAGPIKLSFNGVEGLTLWVDGARVLAHEEIDPHARAGRPYADAGRRSDEAAVGLRVTLDEVPGSPHRRRWCSASEGETMEQAADDFPIWSHVWGAG